MNGIAVSDSSPLIALDQIGRLELVRHLFNKVIVPSGVVHEVRPQLTLPPWIDEQPLTQPLTAQVLAVSLGRGEREAICLAIQHNASWLIMDDLPARRHAIALGLPVVGTIGILVAAKQRGLVAEIRSVLDALIQQYGFHVAPTLYASALKQVGESP